jgi:serine protease AprX
MRIFTVFIILLLSLYSFPQNKYMIYFKDKGINPGQTLSKTSALYKGALSNLTERAIERRKKLLGDEIISYEDLPIRNKYIDILNSLGVKIVHKLTWFNAVSAYIDDSQLTTIRELPFVVKVEPVKVMKFKRNMIEQSGLEKSNDASELNYGSSFTQLNLMDVPIVHSKGFIGEGVIIGLLDTGFRWRDHESLINADVIAEYDFIFDDSITANQPEDTPSQDSHGTSVFSEVGGFKDSTLIGASYGSSFILAKTEDIRSETHVEEDNYAAALIWMENYGVDITSSSLGYSEFDTSTYSYTYEDMNGETTIVTKACELAFSKGVVTITAAGNEGNTSWHYITAPGDGFNTITVGAVYSSNKVTSFSSRGPTYDGRIKPDILAQGSGVFAVSASGFTRYNTGFAGTSAAAPLACGVVGLLLSAHPYLTNVQVRDILLRTADNFSSPDNNRGYGLVSAAKAINYPNVQIDNSNNIIHKIFINDYAVDPTTVEINYSVDGPDYVQQNMSFEGTFKYNFVLPTFNDGDSVEFYFTYSDSSGTNYREPSDRNYMFTYGGKFVTLTPEINNVPTSYVLSQNYPNPFNGQTKINFVSSGKQSAELIVYDILGQKIRILFNSVPGVGLNTISWDGKNEDGLGVSSGVYYYVLKIGDDYFSKKMVLLK